MKNPLPETLYVRWDYPANGEPWLMTGNTPKDMLECASDQQIVGVYELKKKITVKSTVTVSVQEKT